MRKEKLGFILCGTFFVFESSVASALEGFDPFESDRPTKIKTCSSSTDSSEDDKDIDSGKDAASDQDLCDFFAPPVAEEEPDMFDGFGRQEADDHGTFGGSLGGSFKPRSFLLGASLGKSPNTRGLVSKTPNSSPHPSQVMSPVRIEGEDERPSSTPPVSVSVTNPIFIIKDNQERYDPLLMAQDEVKQHRLRSYSRKDPEKQASRSGTSPHSSSVPSGVPLGSSPAPSAFGVPLHGHD